MVERGQLSPGGASGRRDRERAMTGQRMAMMSRPLAALDVGTNTIRLLIARPRPDGGLERLDDRTMTVRLGQGVDADGRLAPERIERAVSAIAELAAAAEAAGAGKLLAVATSAVRDAANGSEFIGRVERETGVRVEIADGAREAQLTFRGALLGRPVARVQLVADIGGGSTEVIVARAGVIAWATSLQLGSGRLTERHLPSDPPAPEEIETARGMAAAALAELPAAAVADAVVVGGTASALVRLWPEAARPDYISRPGLVEHLNRLLAAPAATIAAGGEVDRERARVLPGGAIIIQALMDQFDLEGVTVSQGGIREGLLVEGAASRQ